MREFRENLFMWRIWILVVVLSCHSISASQSHNRPRRGASIYPVFGGGSSGHGSSSSYFMNDPTPFIQYLGGSTGGRGHSGPAPSASSNSYSVQPTTNHGGGNSGYSEGSGSTSFDTNFLNAYALSMRHGQTPSTTAAPSTGHGGWTPIVGRGRNSNSGSRGGGYSGGSSPSPSSSGSLGYGGSFYTSHYGLLSPNFAQSNSLASSHRPVHVPSLDANALASAAQTSFYAQNNLYNVLLSGSRPSTYKGSSNYKK